jgi:uncharacterized protein YndB with AHSA1/START domain
VTSTASVQKLPEPVGDSIVPGDVRVSVLVDGSITEIWAALTKRDEVGRWFGDLSASLAPGGAYRLDFGDGDYFEIQDVAVEPPRHLDYQWRFLGTSPRNAISWTIEPIGNQCRVTVKDGEPHRDQRGVEEMIEGWTDFLRRLRDYRATGQTTRYTWRKEFDGSIELSASPEEAFEKLTSAEGQRHWLPWSADALAAGTVRMTDGGQPTVVTITAVAAMSALSLCLTLASPAWSAPTHCSIELRPRPAGSLLLISHSGWLDISPRDSEQSEQRLRFGTLWVQALRAAKQYVAS